MVPQVFNTTSSHEPSSGDPVNVSGERQQTLASWYSTSDGFHSHSRWQTQMALSKTVYSFEVKEDTVPG